MGTAHATRSIPAELLTDHNAAPPKPFGAAGSAVQPGTSLNLILSSCLNKGVDHVIDRGV
jgi:hypothetical protein